MSLRHIAYRLFVQNRDRSVWRPAAMLLPWLLTPLASAVLVTDLLADEVELPIAIERPEREQPVDFNREILPLLRKNCLACHHSQAAEGGLNLETVALMIAGGDSGPAVVAGDVSASLLISRASGEEEPLMPPEDNSAGAQPLTPEQLGLIALWIEQGAPVGQMLSDDPGPQWQPIAGSFHPIYASQTTPNGRFTIAGYGNGVVVYDRHRDQLVGRLVDPSLPPVAGETAADIDLIQSLAVSPDGQWIASGGYRSVRLWRETYPRIAADQWRPQLTGWTQVGNVALVSDDGRYLASPAADDRIQVLAADSDQPLIILSGHRAALIGGAMVAMPVENTEPAETDPAAAQPDADAVASEEEVAETDVDAAQRDEQAAAVVTGRLVSVDAAGRLLAWNLADGAIVAEVSTAMWPVSAAVSPDLQQIAIVDASGSVQLWELTAGDSPAWQVRASDPLAAITDATVVAWLANDQQSEQPPALLVATDSAGLQQFDAQGQGVIRRYDHGAAVLQLAASPNGQRIVTAGRDGISKLWNAADGQLIATLHGDPQRIQQATHLAANVQRQQGKLERLASHSEELDKRLEGESAALAQAVEARDQANQTLQTEVEKLAAANQATADTQAKITAADGQVADLEAKLAELAEQIEATKAQIEAKKQESAQAAAELEEKQKAATAAAQAKQQAETAANNAQMTVQANTDAQARLQQQIADHQQTVQHEQRHLTALTRSQTRQQTDWPEHASLATAAAFSADSRRLATAHQDGSLRVYDVDNAAVVTHLPPSDGPPPSGVRQQLHFVDPQTADPQTADPPILVRLSAPGGAQAWHLQPQWKLVRQIGGADQALISDRVTAIDFDPSSQRIAIGSGPASRTGQVLVFSVADGSLVNDLGPLHSDTVLSVRFSPTGDRLASGAADRIIRLYSLVDDQPERALEGHTHHVMGLAWNDDAVTLASAGADQTVKIWNVETGEQKRTIAGFTKEVTALQYLPASNQLITAAADGQLRLYNTDDGKLIRSYPAEGDFLFTLTLSPDGSEVTAGGQAGVLRSWPIADEKGGRKLFETVPATFSTQPPKP